MSGLIGRKIGMTSIYDASGKNLPCTVIEAGPCVITQIKTKETDGYEAVQLGFGERKEKQTNKAMKGQFAKASTTPKRIVREFKRFQNLSELKVGDALKVDLFQEGEYIDVIGNSKGRGFQGVVKRHGFGGVGGNSHGQHDRQRAPGSLGGSSYPSRVFRGLRMAGRMGNVRIKMINLQVVKILPEQNLIIIKGSVPGPKGSNVIIERFY